MGKGQPLRKARKHLAADSRFAAADLGSDCLCFLARPNQFAKLIVIFRAEVRVDTTHWCFPGLGCFLDLIGMAKVVGPP